MRSSSDSGSAFEFTSQLFFQEAFTDVVYQQAPYNTRGTRNTLNGNDGVYGQSNGQTLMAVSETDDGYEATSISPSTPTESASSQRQMRAARWTRGRLSP